MRGSVILKSKVALMKEISANGFDQIRIEAFKGKILKT